MRSVLFKYGFKRGFRDASDTDLLYAALAGAAVVVTSVYIYFTTIAG